MRNPKRREANALKRFSHQMVIEIKRSLKISIQINCVGIFR